MLCILSASSDPCFNLAVEEMLLKKRKEEYLLLAINGRSVVSGKHQCIHREVNTRFVTENSIPVIRRITGGGTVFHDEGNLNYTFIRNCREGRQIDFPKHTKPLIDFLTSLGITPVMEGSDVKVNGFKISGNAEHVFRNRVLHHGTVLWDASLDLLRNCIRKDTSAYITRAVASRPSSVMNLSRLVNQFHSIEAFREAMVTYFLETIPGIEFYSLSSEESREAVEIAAKYRTWEWNYAYGPEYEFVRNIVFGGSRVECRLIVKDGLIKEAVSESEEKKTTFQKLAGIRHMPEDIRIILGADVEVDVFDFF